MKRRIKSDSIGFKLAVTFMITIALQSILMSIILVKSGVIRQAEENEYKIFSEKVSSRAANLENGMSNIWTNFDYQTNQIRQYFTDMEVTDGEWEKSANEILEDLTPVIRDTLYGVKTTGAFLILDGAQEDTGSHDAIYLKNIDPGRVNESNIYLLVGPWNVAKCMKIPTDANWTPRLKLDESNEAFYKKPFENRDASDNSKWLGYWSPPFRVLPNVDQALTYSIPLQDKRGNAIGVFGVEITVDYLYHYLPYMDLQGKDSLGYIIVIRSAEDGNIRPLITHGALQKRILDTDEPFLLEAVNEENHIYELINHNSETKIYACMERMGMYYNNTPFSGEEWFLIGLMEMPSLLKFPGKITLMLHLSFAGSLIIGIFISIVVSRWFTKFARLIELSEVPVGAYEYRKRSRHVFMTTQVPRLLNLTREQERRFTRDKVAFKQFMDDLCRSCEPGDNNCLMVVNGEERWLRISGKEKEGICQGIVEDITDEVLECKALETDRDYDGLTGVKNRKAFNRVMEAENEKLKPGDLIGIAMCDLNNLKVVNDSFGHCYGDEYIRFCSNAIHNCFPDCPVFRIGGDEFAVILRGISEETVEQYKNRLMEEMKGYRKKCGVNVGIAVGCAFYSGTQDEKMEDVLVKADMRMYEDKRENKEV